MPRAAARTGHSLGLVRRAGLVDQLELGGEAVGAGVLQQAAHRVGVQVSDELADLLDLVGHHRFQGVKGLRAGASGLKERQPPRRRRERLRRPRDPGAILSCPVAQREQRLWSRQGLTWLSEDAELVASSCRAFMASSAAICFAAFLLGALTVGKVWFPMATQYWNLAGGETITMVLTEGFA